MAVFAAMKMPPQIDFIEMPAILQGKYQYFTQAPMEKMRQAGYTAPFTSLEAAVADYVTSYLQKREPASIGDIAAEKVRKHE
jgi:ADP-L-glycero-D-manno-heptose 6-epimerase